jgi:hypothetical protein
MLETVSYADDLDHDHQFFAEPVSEDAAPDYFNIISNPMDLQKIRCVRGTDDVTTTPYTLVSFIFFIPFLSIFLSIYPPQV